MDYNLYLKIIDLESKYEELFPDEIKPSAYIRLNDLEIRYKVLEECVTNRIPLRESTILFNIKSAYNDQIINNIGKGPR